jgi:hypothetical protein
MFNLISFYSKIWKRILWNIRLILAILGNYLVLETHIQAHICTHVYTSVAITFITTFVKLPSYNHLCNNYQLYTTSLHYLYLISSPLMQLPKSKASYWVSGLSKCCVSVKFYIRFFLSEIEFYK